MKISEIVKKIFFGEKSSPERYAEALRKKGCRVGDDVIVYQPMHSTIDTSRPWLIEIGNHVRITKNVTILTHGYDWSVIKVKTGEILGSSGKVKIGDNVFIGMNSTILKGVTIGNNVIIGANSLVNKDIPDNTVAAGNPVRVICSLDDYIVKRQKAQKDEAVELAIEYYKVYGKWPDEKVLREFLFLFKDRADGLDDNEVFTEIGSLGFNYQETKARFLSTKGEFKDYNDFIQYCKRIVNTKER